MHPAAALPTLTGMGAAFLLSRGVVAVSGEDAVVFLQGLVTNDVHKLVEGQAQYAALLSPQGKFLHDFFLVLTAGKILMDCDQSRMDDLIKRLALYKLRAKVTIEVLPENMEICAFWDMKDRLSIRHAICVGDPRVAAMGYRAIGDRATLREWCSEHGHMLAEEEAYHMHRIALGVPQGGVDLLPEKSFLLEWGVDQLHGVDYQKGCYVGQEVTARTHYRGQVKKAPYKLTADAILPASATVYCGEAEVGEMRSSAGHTGLALLRMEQVAQAKTSGMPLRVGDIIVEATLPPWYAPAATS